MDVFWIVIQCIAAFAGILFILDYFGLRREKVKKALVKLIYYLGRYSPKLVRGYLLAHPYIAIASVIAVIAFGVRATYMLLTGESSTPLWIFISLWVATISLCVVALPYQIRRIRGKDWPPRL